MHNVKVLVKGKDRCTLLVHPDDAVAGGIVDGGRARVTSESGTVEVPVEVSDEMMPGVVSLPHGWGHDRPGTRMSVAREHAGVNNNLLAPTHFVDALSNNAAVNGIPVEIVPRRRSEAEVGRGGGGRNRTHRAGSTHPTRFEDEGGHQTSFTSGVGLPPGSVRRPGSPGRLLRVSRPPTIPAISAPATNRRGSP